MPLDQQRRLTLHGSAVVVVSLLNGLVFMAAMVFPYLTQYPALADYFGPDAQRAWGAAHRAPLLMGVWMLAVAGLMPRLILTTRAQQWLVDLLIWGIWMSTFAVTLAALAGVRGLIGSGMSPVNLVSTSINVLSGGPMLVAAIIMFRGALTATRALPENKGS